MKNKNKKMKVDFNDIVIVPAKMSDIDSRKEIDILENGKLPLITAPMDTVIDISSAHIYSSCGFNVCLPRNFSTDRNLNQEFFQSFGLDEIIAMVNNELPLPKKVLIDIAHGGMRKLFNISKTIKSKYPETLLMIGNIANPDTFKEYCSIGVDYVRIGIGGGSVCTTSANVGVHYPMVSLIEDCYIIKTENCYKTKIVADGGFRRFEDIIKALALGADLIMCGSILSKSFESCSDFYRYEVLDKSYKKIDIDQAENFFNMGIDIYKYYRGMSTKGVQKDWDKKDLTTSEGITMYNKVEYKIDTWLENFSDYLKSAMSYCNSRDLKIFRSTTKLELITPAAYQRFHK